ncbi:phosphohydrolase [Clostridia bacterium]|nr:phosphohydrolase [Clostridia bacterium]
MCKLFAIGDLHLSVNNPKPMDIFGPRWDNHWDKIKEDWREKVGPDDIVLIPGDISWAMYLENAVSDLQLIGGLPGTKVLLRGNHDYWWKSISAVRASLPAGMYAVQNDALRWGKYVIFGSRLWSAPETPGVFETPEDKTIYLRETERLKLSIQAALKIKKDGDIPICMTHYPPFNARKKDSDYTALIERSGAAACVYGHLHGLTGKNEPFIKNNVTYHLTSCDMAGNKLVRIY